MYLMQGLGTIVGTPVAGVLVGQNEVGRSAHDYLGTIIFVSGLMLAATVAAAWVRLEKVVDHNNTGKRPSGGNGR